jgi:hypothetical protein
MTAAPARQSRSIGPMSGKSAHLLPYSPARESFEPSERVCNSMMREPLSLTHEWRGFVPRQGSMVAYSLSSRGTGC